MALDIEILRRKIPFAETPDSTLETLAKVAVVTEHQQGNLILDYGENHDSTPFLIWGKVGLTAQDGKTKHVDQSHASARYGLAMLKPSKYQIRAQQNHTILFWLKSSIVDTFITNQTRPFNVDVGI